ncbi:hypothetical protein D9M73_230200 [compost metagenome]
MASVVWLRTISKPLWKSSTSVTRESGSFSWSVRAIVLAAMTAIFLPRRASSPVV